MKYIYHLPLLFIFISACAQDSLFLKNDTVYAVTVTGMNRNIVKYRKWNTADSAIYSMPNSMVSFIKYSVDSLPEDTVLPPLLPDITYLVHGSKWHVGMYNKGAYDGLQNYDRHQGTAIEVWLGSLFLGPILGLIPTATVAKSHIPDRRLNYPNESLIKNASYYAGYTYGAHRKKIFEAWIGYVGASLLDVGVGCIILQGVIH